MKADVSWKQVLRKFSSCTSCSLTSDLVLWRHSLLFSFGAFPLTPVEARSAAPRSALVTLAERTVCVLACARVRVHVVMDVFCLVPGHMRQLSHVI